MLKKALFVVAAVLIFPACDQVQGADKVPAALNHTVKDIDGKEVKLSKYEGRVLLVVNLASR